MLFHISGFNNDLVTHEIVNSSDSNESFAAAVAVHVFPASTLCHNNNMPFFSLWGLK